MLEAITHWAQPLELKDWLGIWGAVLATVLAVLKLVELWRDRMRIATSRNLDSREEEGNTIAIFNPTKTPLMILHWELFWKKRKNFKNTIYPIEYGDPSDSRSIIIPAYSTHSLNFRDADYFDWGVSTVPLGKIYLSLHIVGKKRPVTLQVYDPSR